MIPFDMLNTYVKILLTAKYRSKSVREYNNILKVYAILDPKNLLSLPMCVAMVKI